MPCTSRDWSHAEKLFSSFFSLLSIWLCFGTLRDAEVLLSPTTDAQLDSVNKQ